MNLGGYCKWICWIKVKNVFYKKIDSKKYNTAKGVNVETEFDGFKDVLFNEKIIRHKMKIWKEHMKLTIVRW